MVDQLLHRKKLQISVYLTCLNIIKKLICELKVFISEIDNHI
jgi:hypothetical protein